MNRNAVDQGHTAGSQQAPHRPEIGGHGRRTDIFQHTNRYDPIELAGLVAIVAQCKIQPLFKTVLGCGFPRIGKLAFRQGDAGHGQILAAFRPRHGKPSPAASHIENAVSRPQIQLGGKPRQLGFLSCLETVIRAVEIGAGILATLVNKCLEQLVCQVVMLGYVASGALARVEMPQPVEAIAEAQRQTADLVPRPVTRIRH